MSKLLICKLLFVTSFLFILNISHANQRYENISISIRNQLNYLLMENKTYEFNHNLNWQEKQFNRIKKSFRFEDDARQILKIVEYDATRFGIDKDLVLAIIQTESNFNKYAISSVGALGIMQIMPFWIEVIGDKSHNLFNERTNIRYGIVIFRHYLSIERGNVERALARYNGSLGSDRYYTKVLNHYAKFKK